MPAVDRSRSRRPGPAPLLLCLVFAAPAGAAPPPAGADDAPPDPDARASGSDPGQATTINIGGFTPPPQAEYDPDTTAEPGLLDLPRERVQDRTYGPSGEGRQVGFDIIDPSVYGDDGYDSVIPDYHVVQAGDTLSGICAYYYGDMYLWPKIWSFNPNITNAHWIFPGDRIRLTDPYAEVTGPGGQGLAYAETYDPRDRGGQTYLLERYAFIDDEELDRSMKIVGGADAHVMMATLDVAYVGYEEDNPPIPGERLSVYRKTKPVYDIEVKGKKQRLKQGKRIGWLVEVVGEVYVREVAEKSASAEIVDAVRPVERGQRVGELKTRFSRVSPTANQVTLNGLVVETIRERELSGETQFVIINLGADDGLARGNTLQVVQKGDAYSPDHRLYEPYEPGHPRRVLAQLLVLQVQGDSALTVVTDSRREVLVGNHVEILAAGEPPEDFEPYDRKQRVRRVEGDARGEAGDGEASASGELTVGG